MGNPNKIWHDIYSLVFLGSMQKLTSIVGAQFRQNEIAAIQEHYSLSAEEVNEIFFATAVSLKDTAHPATPEKSA